LLVWEQFILIFEPYNYYLLLIKKKPFNIIIKTNIHAIICLPYSYKEYMIYILITTRSFVRI
jgi:hypothetical protein